VMVCEGSTMANRCARSSSVIPRACEFQISPCSKTNVHIR
jgi:hypothetical protein